MDKDQAIAFLSAFVDKINAQDNRCTAFPYYYVVRTRKWRLCKDGYGHGETREGKVDWNGDPNTYREEDKEQFIKDHIENAMWRVNEPENYPTYTELEYAEYAEEKAEYDAALAKAKQAAEDEWEGLETFEEEEYFEEENIFFTEEGYQEHVRLNGHNLGRKGEYHSYVRHAFRNPEISDLLKAVAAVIGKELKKP